jgi:hypothetical protein
MRLTRFCHSPVAAKVGDMPLKVLTIYIVDKTKPLASPAS